MPLHFLNDVVNDIINTKINNYIIIASLKRELACYEGHPMKNETFFII